MKKIELKNIKYLKEKINNPFTGFIDFIRSQGVIGLAIGVVLGTSITKFVTSLVTDIINPLVGILISRAGDLKANYFLVGNAKIMWGSFVNSFIDFVIIALVVYFGVKILGIDKLDKKKE